MRRVLIAGMLLSAWLLPSTAGAATYSNPTPIGTSAFFNDVGSMLPYPSAIGVYGVTGTVSGVKVTLPGVAAAQLNDLGAQLVGPTGVHVLLATTQCITQNTTASPLTLTFDDAAAAPLPTSATCVSGSYKPGRGPGNTGFQPPAPNDGFASAFSALTGSDPNGLWYLYGIDGAIGNRTVIQGGWILDLTTTPPPSAKKCKKKGHKRSAAAAKKKRCKKKKR
jgi:hypothetical protein